MNTAIPRIGAAVVAVSVFLFAVTMIMDHPLGSYVVCMFLPLGYIPMVAGFYRESGEEHRVAATIALVFAAIYATLIFLVYFAQVTTVRQDVLSGEGLRLLDFQRGGLLFNYDLLGYGIMALSTFFCGLSLTPKSVADKWLKALFLLHGAFFPGCFILPMTGAFSAMATGEAGNGGTVALLIWCAYFLPVSLLALVHFQRQG